MVTLSPNAPNPIGALEEPQQQVAKPRRNRNVAAPGSRGGHYRRIWSNKLHKFYFKYGKSDNKLSVENAPVITPKKESQENSPKNDPLRVAVDSRVPGDALEELLNGLFQELMQNFSEYEEGTGLRHKGRKVSFGKITPVEGEIVTGEHHRRKCYLYNENGDQIEYKYRRIRSPIKLKSFFCYMTARYAMSQFVDGEKSFVKKSVIFSQNGGSNILKETLSKTNINNAVAEYQPPEQFSDLHQSLEMLKKAHSSKAKQKNIVQDHIKKAFKWIDKLDSDRLEKSGPKQIQESMKFGGTRRYGSVGSGSTSIFRMPGRPKGTSQNLTVASAGLPAFSTMSAPKDIAEITDKDWRGHRHLKIGARVRVQHPFEHDKPIWGKISDIGEHGIQVTDQEGNVTNIRWPHILDLQQRIDNTPQNAFEIARMRIPIENVSGISKNQMDAAEKELRRISMPFDKDVINAGHADKNQAYSYLFSEKVPIDDIAATQMTESNTDAGMAKLTQGLINHAISMRVPVNADLLKELPFERVISVLHHHLNAKQKEGTNE